jgi:predicted PurR-regulated permease PerM
MKSPIPGTTNSEVSLTITVKTFFKVLLLILVTIAILAALNKALYAITLVFIAFFLAVALNAPVSLIGRYLPGPLRGSRSSATALSFLIVVLILGFILYNLIPPIVHQTEIVINNSPHIVQDIRNNNSALSNFIGKYHLQGQIDNFTHSLTKDLQNSTGAALTTVTHIATSIFAIVTILVLTFMMLVEGPHWMQVSRQLLPVKHRVHFSHLTQNMYRAVRGYVNGQVVLAAVAALVVLPGLLIFHVSYPITLMAVIFVCALIPVIGHFIAIVIVTLVALFHSPFSAIGIFVYYLLYQQIEAYLVQPRLQANTTKLSPLFVFLAVVIGVNFGGLLGGLVAIPVMACLRVGVIDYLSTKHLAVEQIPTSSTDSK